MVCYSRNRSGLNAMSTIDVDKIEGIMLTSIDYSSDSRGKFVKCNPKEFLESKLTTIATSINPTAGTIRGIHLQVEPYAEEKIISCIQGSTFEVVIDLRPNSVSFGRIATGN